VWAPINFDDVCTHFDVNEHGDGRRWHFGGNLVRAVAEQSEPIEVMTSVEHRIRWQSGTRRATGAEITLRPHTGQPHVITLDPILTFQSAASAICIPSGVRACGRAPTRSAARRGRWPTSTP